MQKLLDPPFDRSPLDGPYARGLIGCWAPSHRRALIDIGPFSLNPTPAGTDNHTYGVGPWGPWFRAAGSYNTTSRYELPSRTGDLWYERLNAGHCTVLAVLQNVTTGVAWTLASLLTGSPIDFVAGNSSDAGGLILYFRVGRSTQPARCEQRLPAAGSGSWSVLAATSQLDRYIRGYWNGRLLTGGTVSLGSGTVSGSSSQAWTIANDADGGEAHPRPIALLAIWDRAMLPGEIAALSDNPSLIWDAPRAWPAVGGATYQGTAAIAGTGALAAIGNARRAGAATLAGAGALTAVGSVVRAGSVAVAATGALSATGNVRRSGVATFAGEGTIIAIGDLVLPPGSATFAGTGELLAVGNVRRAGQAAVAGAGALSAVGNVRRSGAASFAGTGLLTVSQLGLGLTTRGELIMRPDITGALALRADIAGDLLIRPDIAGELTTKPRSA